MASRPDLSGKWKFHHQENFDEFLTANGVPWLIKKAAGFSKPTCVIEQNGDDIHIKIFLSFKTQEDKFTIGTDYEQSQPNGALFIVTPTWEDNKLVLNLVPKAGHAGKPQKHTRFIENDMLHVVLEVENVKATRVFEREKSA